MIRAAASGISGAVVLVLCIKFRENVTKYVTPARGDFAGVIILDILYRIMYIIRYRRNV